jgi:hypothetical protein
MRSSKQARAAGLAAPPPTPARPPLKAADVRGMSLIAATAAVLAADRTLDVTVAQQKAGLLLRDARDLPAPRPFFTRPLNEEA